MQTKMVLSTAFGPLNPAERLLGLSFNWAMIVLNTGSWWRHCSGHTTIRTFPHYFSKFSYQNHLPMTGTHLLKDSYGLLKAWGNASLKISYISDDRTNPNATSLLSSIRTAPLGMEEGDLDWPSPSLSCLAARGGFGWDVARVSDITASTCSPQLNMEVSPSGAAFLTRY